MVAIVPGMTNKKLPAIENPASLDPSISLTDRKRRTRKSKKAATRVALPPSAPEVIGLDRPVYERMYKMGDRYVSWEFLMST